MNNKDLQHWDRVRESLEQSNAMKRNDTGRSIDAILKIAVSYVFHGFLVNQLAYEEKYE